MKQCKNYKQANHKILYYVVWWDWRKCEKGLFSVCNLFLVQSQFMFGFKMKILQAGHWLDLSTLFPYERFQFSILHGKF